VSIRNQICQFSLPNKLNLAFLKAFGSENYHRLALNGEKNLVNCVRSVIENMVGDFQSFVTAKR